MQPLREGTAAGLEVGSAFDLALALVDGLAATEETGLQVRLRGLAEILAGLPGLQGAAIAPFDDEGSPLTSGTFSFAFREDASELEVLSELQRSIAGRIERDRWLEIDPTSVCRDDPRGGKVAALPVSSGDRAAGLVLAIHGPGAGGAEDSLRRIGAIGPFLASALRSCLQREAWTRVERLQELSRETLDEKPWNFKAMVARLASLFDAGAVTMLLEEQGELRLSASTDPLLDQQRPVIYGAGEGLTGYVFQTGQAVRIANLKDREEVFRVTGLRRAGPRFAERDHSGSPTLQFLGVPMRLGRKTVGVLRIARREGVARFTREDEKALQFFADILGAALAPTRDLLLEGSILKSVTEAIAVSRREQRPDGTVLNRIIMANPGAERLLQRGRRDLEGRDARDIYDPSEFERIRRELQPARESARLAGHAEHEPILTRMKRADGSLVPVTISYHLLANQLVRPPTLYTIGLARETSQAELKAEQHQRLLELLDAMKIAYFRADPAGITQASTSADCEITGYTAKELQVTPRTHLYPDPSTRAGMLRRARENGGHLARALVQMTRKNGESFWGEGDLRILKDSMGQEIGSEGLYRDVTARIRLQGFINAETGRVLSDSELFTKLEKDAELQLDYVSSLSHQLQTPLGSLLETLRNFEKRVIGQKLLRQRLPYVIGQTVVCTRLVRNLSYMDKILRGEPFRRERVALARLAIDTKLDFHHLLDEKHLEIRIDDASIERYVPVYGHQEMLRQVLVILIDNAIKYSRSKSIVTIRGRTWPEGNALEIGNEGLPLSAEERERIFERGFRTKKAQAAVPHGTGLGLWLVRKILEPHGATIRCLEVLEGGRKQVLFRILFPHLAAVPRRAS